MSLNKFTLRPMRPTFYFYRMAATHALPEQARIHQQPPKDEKGFMDYARNWSRDPRFKSFSQIPQKGNLPTTFLFRRLSYAYELYPLVFLISSWAIMAVAIVVYSFEKIEIWVDKTSGVDNPTDWERIRNNYWKYPTVMIDPNGVSHRRLELMEVLEDEMLEAAKKRGTRLMTD